MLYLALSFSADPPASRRPLIADVIRKGSSELR